MFLVGLILTTLVVGMFVLLVKNDYRIEQITISNEDYYQHVEVTSEKD